jgi:ketosteroid isomerase-like protein
VYPAAVEKGDTGTMARILADDFVLTIGQGKTCNKADLLASARDRSTVYEHQVASSRTVRGCGDTAVVTALLWLEGTSAGKPFEYRRCCSDLCARQASGRRYVVGHASLPLPADERAK